ncbi:hypothetical protein [Anaeromyxobacter oryzae]|uniref:Cytochrome c domain-containing protein n=1 Tax=Anaeromyxobacter oryzae TaxID=2918170 RepID=A0ABM7WYL9_9BACT|nr:hypothetical protein [Anaeromyxobacter oryzae]BDG04613.1 hypothetical protein AMOR_36090 [Anaeromyxobacter oryzae]
MRIGGTMPSGHSLNGKRAVAAQRATPVAVALLAAVAALSIAACEPQRKVGALNDAGTAQAKSFSSIAQDILVPRCATSACHSGSPPPAEPTLDADLAWSALVGVPSQQASGTQLVEPFAPERSYLVMKLRGTAGSAGGIATVMPIGEAALDEADIAAIEAWIANGAPND